MVVAISLFPPVIADRGISRFLAAADLKNKRCNMDPLVCYGTRSPGPDCCDDQCVDLPGDSANCGKCGKCVDLAFDKKNYDSCFNECRKNCFGGLCDYA
ncbi:stigma-specific STIG1-like protein 3 [Canna indica]|uniref:Stigma-specific STIG1-like protein 3 n=1 Tax=Canna indica TaxID=4628 RepID=A0AAQ3KPD2_9LILI|nr:stigma-specific STIG1-like protein 3 [Canna indica]